MLSVPAGFERQARGRPRWPIGERQACGWRARLKAAAPSPIIGVVGDFESLRAGLRENGRAGGEVSGPSSRVPQDAPPTSRTQAYDILHAGPSDLVARVGQCLIVLSHALTLDGVNAIARGMGKLTQRQQTACSISIVERKSGPGTSPEVRTAVAEIVRKYDTSISGAAVVCDGSGFRATAVRSVVTAINMASRASHPSKVFASCEPAFEWLESTRPNRDLDIELLAQAVTALRPRLQELMTRAALAQSR